MCYHPWEFFEATLFAYPLLQHALHFRTFTAPENTKIRPSPESLEPDVQTEHERKQRADHYEPSMDFEPSAIGWEKHARYRHEESHEDQTCIHKTDCVCSFSQCLFRVSSYASSIKNSKRGGKYP